jgi:hypothetical protein
MGDEDRSLQLLWDESKRVADIIEKKQGTFGQFGGIGIGIVVAASSFAANPGRLIILLAGPIVLTLILMIMLQHLADAHALVYYHAQLEKEINSRTSGAVLRLSGVLHERTYWSVPFGRTLLLLLIGGGFTLSGYATYNATNFRTLIIAFFWASLILSILTLVAGVRDLISSERQARQIYASPDSRTPDSVRFWLR